jgi:cell division inhibitor SepF
MTSMLKRGMSWLGLGPDVDDDYYYDDEDDAPEPALRSRAASRARPEVVDDWDDEEEPGGIRVLPPDPNAERPTARGVVRPIPSPPPARPQVVTPTSFNDAQDVGDLFKRQQPVILNLSGVERDLARRLLDFSSGVTYALGGSVERVAPQVYLLTPADVEVSADDRRRIKAGDLGD